MTETDQPHIISDAMLEAYNLAHNDWWKASAPVLTQGQATVVDREAMRAGLRAVLDALTAAGWRKPGTAGICGDTAPTLAFITNPTQPHCTLIAGHAGWHQDDNGARWQHHGDGWETRGAPVTPGAGFRHVHVGELYVDATPPQSDWSHEIAFDDDGNWAIGHPDGCPGQAFGDCDVQRAVTEQPPGPDLRASMAGLRFRCAVNDLRDRFLLGDRIDGDAPVEWPGGGLAFQPVPDEQTECCEHGVSMDEECRQCLVDTYGPGAVPGEQAEG